MKNHYLDNNGYEVVHFICENSPTNKRVKDLDGHGHERFAIGNGAGWRWLGAWRTPTCPLCGGRMIDADNWKGGSNG